MSKVDDAAAIPKAGRQNPESEKLPIAEDLNSEEQLIDSEQVMQLEAALVRALQQLATKPEN
jgi:hypothetical protein